MCGIFALLNNKNIFPNDFIERNFIKGQDRGPEISTSSIINDKLFLGFHRLAINGLDEESNQPITIGKITLICNGEIYNYKSLYENLKITPKTNSDCEVIIHLYMRYGIEQTLRMLDGVYAFVLYDYNDLELPVFVARDPFGVRSLYQLNMTVQYNDYTTLNFHGFASEMKCLSEFCNSDNCENIEKSEIQQFQPGTFSKLYLRLDKAICDYQYEIKNKRYFLLPLTFELDTKTYTEKTILNTIYDQLSNAVKKRVSTTEREVACLLSGGLDSSLITGLVCKFNTLPTEKIKTFSIGLSGSDDLKYAREVADFLKTDHHEVVVTEDEMFDAIPEVIAKIESYDTTTVRASVGNYLISKYIKNNSEAKVIFNGDGSDETTGGYMYFHAAPDEFSFDAECRRLLQDIYTFDVLRSDKSISSNGLEPRTPFLDRNFVQFYMSLPASMRCHNKKGDCEKYLLRKAFHNKGVIPESVLWRTKEAFSDGVSGDRKSWYQIIDDKIIERFGSKYDITTRNSDGIINPPTTREQKYYRDIFDKLYPNLASVVPYFWMPKFIEAHDSSARTLNIYREKHSKDDIDNVEDNVEDDNI